jgi:hypothetical protein
METQTTLSKDIRILADRKDEVSAAVLDAVYTLGDIQAQIVDAQTALNALLRRVETEKALGDEYEALRVAKALELSIVHDALVASDIKSVHFTI